jgi:transcription-repair coupling factor (superfamily II helicase)
MGRHKQKAGELFNAIQSQKNFQNLVSDIQAGIIPPGLGLMRGARLALIAALNSTLKWPMVVVVERMDQGLAIADELSFWMDQEAIFFFPEPTTMFYENAPWGVLTRRDRLRVLTELSHYFLPGFPKPEQPLVVITTVKGLMTRTMPRQIYLKSVRRLQVGQEIQPETLIREWAGLGYEATEIVVMPGQFSKRGGLLDIWPAAEEYPVRLDFFGDEIDSIRQFDPASQRTIHQLKETSITPASEIIASKAAEKGLAGQTLHEFYLPLVYAQNTSLLDYLPKKSLVVLDDMQFLETIANELEEKAVRVRQESIQEGILDEGYPPPYVSWSEIMDSLNTTQWLELGYSSGEEPSKLAQQFAPGERFGGKLKPFIQHLIERCSVGDHIMVVSRQLKRIRELWYEQECSFREPVFLDGSISDGWVLTDEDQNQRYYLYGDGEIFGWDRPQPRKRQRPAVQSPEMDYADLRPGDYVVHVDYGIGRFTGLVQRVLEGTEREFLNIAYGENDQLFVPVHQADRLSRYIGPDGNDPRLTRLGTQDWSQAKAKVREAVQEIAQDLLELYARRSVVEGIKFSKDTVWQQELEASFPYVETEDQIKAINEVKTDMESTRPMDRLLCGDVGYGKTEVALRAAFKAVMDGKQVAILVPTTVLAQQHYETFRERLAPFPVNVEMLSRFRTAKEQDEILLRLAVGELDIVIGTHRLIQKDVVFKELGLLIIDEEQRFGVTHKEFFKKMRTELDVLTLTATPIPRTLYMALTGVRDISVINTPPAERQPVVTHIGPYSQKLVRQAIIRELERGGQVFFVHNRVQTIGAMKSHLNNLVPEAKVGVGHGQMKEGQLSNVMEEFTSGKIDVLLCTSIIESGLDIPNANTLIVDRGDAFGLAQLYQLRGRVGRGAQRAYAYFFRHRKKAATSEGQERLETIAEYTQLGAGYSIAMRDLEMRGAGELLGTRQHGAIASVGFHLYTRLLGQAVRAIKSGAGIINSPELPGFKEIKMAVSVDLPLDVGVPVDYVSDQRMRLSIYRRMADIESINDIQEIETEFSDRFGTLPKQVKNLLYQIKIKILAEQAGMASVGFEGQQMVLKFPPLPAGSEGRNLPEIGLGVRPGKNAYWISLKHIQKDWQIILPEVIQDYIASRQND